MIDFNRFLKMNPWKLMKKIIGFEEIYTIAYRKREGQTLLEGDLLQFDRMPYSNTYWYADPILVSHQGESYLFLESFDMRTNLGSIAYAKFGADGKLSAPQIIIQEPYHMSFPMVFSWNEQLYMIPETCANRSLNLYRCDGSMDRWTLVKSFPVEEELVDTVATACYEDHVELITSAQHGTHKRMNKWQKFKIFREGEDFRLEADETFNSREHYSYMDRTAGSLITEGGRKILPTQESTETDYGVNLYLNDYSAEDITHMPVLKKVTVDNILLPDVPQKQQIGVHSYGLSSKYEVVDMRYFRFSPKVRIRKIFNLGRKLLCTLRCFCF